MSRFFEEIIGFFRKLIYKYKYKYRWFGLCKMYIFEYKLWVRLLLWFIVDNIISVEFFKNKC